MSIDEFVRNAWVEPVASTIANMGESVFTYANETADLFTNISEFFYICTCLFFVLAIILSLYLWNSRSPVQPTQTIINISNFFYKPRIDNIDQEFNGDQVVPH